MIGTGLFLVLNGYTILRIERLVWLHHELSTGANNFFSQFYLRAVYQQLDFYFLVKSLFLFGFAGYLIN